MATAIQSYKLLISSIYSGDSNREISNLLSVLQGVIHPPEIRLVFEWKLFCNKLLDSVLDWTFSNLQNCIRFRGSLESLSNRRALGPIGSKLKVVRKWQLSISDIFIRTKNAWRVILAIQEISQLWFEVFSAVGKYPFQYVSPSTIGCRFLVTYSWQFLLLKEVLWQKKFFFCNYWIKV